MTDNSDNTIDPKTDNGAPPNSRDRDHTDQKMTLSRTIVSD